MNDTNTEACVDPGLQQKGVEAAAKYLQHVGYKVLNQNWRNACGRWDLVCTEPGADGDVIIFVDVAAGDYEIPTPPRMFHRRRVCMEQRAIAWIDAHREAIDFATVRFDRVDVGMLGPSRALIRHVSNWAQQLDNHGIQYGDAERLIGNLQDLINAGEVIDDEDELLVDDD